MAMDVARTCLSMFAHLAARGHRRRALHAGVLAHVNRSVAGWAASWGGGGVGGWVDGSFFPISFTIVVPLHVFPSY